MTKEEKIKKIFQDAQEQVMAVLLGDDKTMAEAAANIDATASKIMKDTFTAKTMLVDLNNINKDRYGVLDYIPNSDIIELYESCKAWCETGVLADNYRKYCENMAIVFESNLEDELAKNIDLIILKYKEINGNSTGLTNGETQA